LKLSFELIFHSYTNSIIIYSYNFQMSFEGYKRFLAERGIQTVINSSGQFVTLAQAVPAAVAPRDTLRRMVGILHMLHLLVEQ
jgi:hypothetical protein